MIHVYTFNVENFNEDLKAASRALLPEPFEKEIMRYKFPEDRAKRRIAKLLLRKAILSTKKDLRLLYDYKRDDRNKPFIDGWMPFSISYSGKYVVLAFGEAAMIGIDIERISDIETQSILSYFCPEERDYISRSEDPQTSFFRIWVKKEAILKAIGTGIVQGLDKFNCLDDTCFVENKEWNWTKLDVHPDYLCYCCTDTSHPLIDVLPVPPDKLLS